MPHIRLLDSDFLINFIRTLSLIEQFEDVDAIIDDIHDNDHFNLISTVEVRDEVNHKIQSNGLSEFDEFFHHTNKQARQINRRLFRNIRIIDVRKYNLTKLFASTDLRDMGERSLVVLFSTKYHAIRENQNDSVHIVSNNYPHVLHFLRKAKQLEENKLRNLNELEILQSIHDFYHELFYQCRFDKGFCLYYFFVSNIDARLYKRDMIHPILQRLNEMR